MKRVTQLSLGISFAVSLLAASSVANAEAPVAPCCSSGDHGVHSQGTSALGQTSPSVQNFSQLPDWRVYTFVRNGIRYIEVADQAGAPRAAFAAIGGSLLTLPIGADYVQQVALHPELAAVVYEDEQLSVGVRTNLDGTVSWQVFVK